VPAGWNWHVFVNTSLPAGEAISDIGSEPLLADQRTLLVGPRSVVILVGKERPNEGPEAHLSVPANIASLPVIGRFVLRAAGRAGLNDQTSYGLRLAVHEIASNCIIHGQSGRRGEGVLDLYSTLQDETLTIILEDTGVPYDPRQTPAPANLAAPLEQRAMGGLGVFLALRSVGEFRFERVGNKNRNIFIVKRAVSRTG
jgi:anti-sigma regulatory factor (Ser/Thr protein kinase)